MTDPRTGSVFLEILFRDVGEVAGFVIFSEQMVKGLVLARADMLGDCLVPFLGIIEFRIHIVYHSAEGEEAMFDDLANVEFRLQYAAHAGENGCTSLAVNSITFPANWVIWNFDYLDANSMGERRIPQSDKEWLDALEPDAYRVLRREGTEAPFSSPLNEEHRNGRFVCAGCGKPLFESSHKFNSGTGWPSFFQAIEGSVETKRDFKLLMPRTEYHCADCGGHQGHVFKDGPAPTGLRYCNNGVALKFEPGED